MGRRTGIVVAVTIAASLSSPGRAAAAPTEEKDTQAQVLFDAAKALMAKKRFAEACPKLEQSQRIQPGGGTLMFLALCHEGEGKTATAWIEFNEVLSVAVRDRRADRERVAREHLDTLGPSLERLTIIVPPATAAIAGLVVETDGVPLTNELRGTPVPVNPGEHLVTATAPSFKPWRQTVRLGRPGETVSVEIPPLDAEPGAPPAPSAKPPAVQVAPEPSPTRSSWGTQKTIALVSGGVGLVGLGIGTGFGLSALAKKRESDRACPGGNDGPCTAEGADLSKSAVAAGNVSTVAFVAGIAALGAGAVLWLTASRVRVAASASASGGGALWMTGTF